MDLKQDLEFGRYEKDRLNGSIFVYNLPIEFKVEESLDPQLNGKTFPVKAVSYEYVYLMDKKVCGAKTTPVMWKKIKGELLFNGQKIEKENLFKELFIKNAKLEFDNLVFSNLKNGKTVFETFTHQGSLINFFKKYVETFFILEECLYRQDSKHSYKFCWPKSEEDKARLSLFIKETSPHLANQLDNLFFNQEELENKNKNKMKL